MEKCARIVSGLIVLIILAGTAAASVQADSPAGIKQLRQIDPNLSGAGVNIGIISRSITYIDGEPQNDYQPDIDHVCFDNAKLQLNDEGHMDIGISEHCTAVCSIIFGADANKPEFKGVASKSNGEVFEFWHFLKTYVFNNISPEVDILSASMGSVFEDWWTRGLEVMVEQHGIVVVAGIGNGARAHDPPLYPAAGTNVIGVGVAAKINGSEISVAEPNDTSCGPTSDMRCKPDLVAPVLSKAALAGTVDEYLECGNYSSFATPMVTGTIALLQQKIKSKPNLASAIAPEVMKAILVNSAKKLPYWHKGKVTKDDDHSAPLDLLQGAGMLDSVRAYSNLMAGQYEPGVVSNTGWDFGQVRLETKNEYQFEVNEPNDKMITATVAFNRHYSNKYPFERLCDKDVDIRLELWGIDSQEENADVMLDYSDSKVDNVEHIYFAADVNYNEYKLAVSFADDVNEPEVEKHDYAIAWAVTDKATGGKEKTCDFNYDGTVDIEDLMMLTDRIREFKIRPEQYIIGDVNEDGDIDVNDISVFLNHLEPEQIASE